MGTHYDNFTSQEMVRLADMFQAGEDARREFCRSNRHRTRQLMERLRSERNEASRTRARERSQFIRELHAEGRRLRERCAVAFRERAEQSQERAEQSQELARDRRATAGAFRDAQRARRMRVDARGAGGTAPLAAAEATGSDHETSKEG